MLNRLRCRHASRHPQRKGTRKAQDCNISRLGVGLCFGHDRQRECQQPLEIQEKVRRIRAALGTHPTTTGEPLPGWSGVRTTGTTHSPKGIAALSASLYAKLEHQPGATFLTARCDFARTKAPQHQSAGNVPLDSMMADSVGTLAL